MRLAIAVIGLLFLFQLGCTANPEEPESTPTEPPATSQAESGDSMPIIIDVRTQEEWDAGHHPDAILIPHQELPDKIAGIAPNKSIKLVLY